MSVIKKERKVKMRKAGKKEEGNKMYRKRGRGEMGQAFNELGHLIPQI